MSEERITLRLSKAFLGEIGDDRTIEEAEPKIELENHFILRLPPAQASQLKLDIRSGEKHGKKCLKIRTEDDMRHAEVKLKDWKSLAEIQDLPTIVECFKACDNKMFYKVADVSQIMICDDNSEKDEELDPSLKGKKHLYPHGLTAPLKNARKKRFRKTLRKKTSESAIVDKEVKMLLRADMEATNTWFELVDDDASKICDEHEVNDDEPLNGQPKFDTCDIFGELSSSDEDSDEEINVTSDIPIDNNFDVNRSEFMKGEEMFANGESEEQIKILKEFLM